MVREEGITAVGLDDPGALRIPQTAPLPGFLFRGPFVEWCLPALLAGLAYVHVLWQPLISDDYVQIGLGRQYGPAAQWPALAHDVLYRSRATSILITHWTEALFGLAPWLLYATMLILHFANTLLVAALVRSAGFGSKVAVAAAAYFAVQAGHQEAVMWYAALPELLVFTSLALFVLAWRRWITGGGVFWILAMVAFTAGLLSKESAVLAVPLAALMNWQAKATVGKWLSLLPATIAVAAYAWGIFDGREEHLHLNDGTFSLHAPFWITLRNSMGRLFWFWGAVALVWMAAARGWRAIARPVQYALVWCIIAFLPYVFLTYMPRVPSRHTYLASAGLALLVGSAWVMLSERWSYRRWPIAVAALVLGTELGYLWLVKRPQLLERARPTEELIVFAQQHPGPFHLRCWPIQQEVAVSAIRETLGRPASDVVTGPSAAQGLPEFCFQPAEPPGNTGRRAK